MWVVTIEVSLPEGADAQVLRQELLEHAVPVVRGLEGLVDATWTISEDRARGIGIYRFANQEGAHARAASVGIGDAAPGGAIVTNVEVLEVLVDVTG